MPTKEAVVLLLDANESMASEVDATTTAESIAIANDEGTSRSSKSSSSKKRTRFDCAKEASIAILSDLMVRSKTNEATVAILHTEATSNQFYEEDENIGNDDDDDDDGYGGYYPKRTAARSPFPNITEISGDGRDMGICRPLPDLLRAIDRLKPTAKTNEGQPGRVIGGGDFESGLVYAADALCRRTAGKKFERRIVLLTDAEHRVATNEDSDDSDSDGGERHSHQRLLVALDKLRAMGCRIQVVGMDFKYAADFDTPVSGPSAMKERQVKSEGTDSPMYDTDDGSDDDDDENDDVTDADDTDDDDGGDLDILEIKRENEKYLIRLANMTGGFVYSSKEVKATIDKILGSRVVQNPSKRKLIVEIAPGWVLEDARFYKLISKTAGIPLKKKLSAIVRNDVGAVGDGGSSGKPPLEDEPLRDYETAITHWNPEDDNEELLGDRMSYAYRFGSDLLPFSPIDEKGLKGDTEDSPVKLTILGYVPDGNVPRYLLVDAPCVLSGHESRRCCAAISALAAGLRETGKVAIATFVQSAGKDPILCGLFPMVEDDDHETIKRDGDGDDDDFGDKPPLRLIVMQLPFSGDVRYPRLDGPDGDPADETSASARCCDDLIDDLMLPPDVLDHRRVPNHKVRSFYKTVVKRVLDETCDVVSTRVVDGDDGGTDSMDTPLEIRERAQNAVTAFYDHFRISKQPAL